MKISRFNWNISSSFEEEEIGLLGEKNQPSKFTMGVNRIGQDFDPKRHLEFIERPEEQLFGKLLPLVEKKPTKPSTDEEAVKTNVYFYLKSKE